MMEKIRVRKLNLWYGDFRALKDINIDFKENSITAIIGPSGCGKSTLLRCLNRMNDLIDGVKVKGDIFLDGINILEKNIDLLLVRKKIGMVFQRPNPFPFSIYENIAFGVKIHNSFKKEKMDEIVERSLKEVDLWKDLNDKLKKSALSLSLEQQQRLCIARVLATRPEVIIMDEPCSALDPQATFKIEELTHTLKKNYTIIIVTHNMQQAARVSDYAGFMLLGELIEFDKTDNIFTSPKDKRTEDYITGRFG